MLDLRPPADLKHLPTMEVLLERARGGSRPALHHLLALLWEPLKQKAKRQLGPKLRPVINPSDLAQETCIRALVNFSNFEGMEVGRFVAWLDRILHNLVQDCLRRGSLDAVALQPLDGSAGVEGALSDHFDTPQAEALMKEKDAAIAEAMQRLDDSDQRLLRLRFWEDKSYKEIAAEMDIVSDDAAKQRCLRAIRSLKVILRGNHGSA